MANITELPTITFNEKVFSAVTHGRTGMAKLRGVWNFDANLPKTINVINYFI